MEKSLKINIPEGYEIDTEKSTFAEIVFKPINSLKTWEDCIKLLENKIKFFYFITDSSDLQEIKRQLRFLVEMVCDIMETD